MVNTSTEFLYRAVVVVKLGCLNGPKSCAGWDRFNQDGLIKG